MVKQRDAEAEARERAEDECAERKAEAKRAGQEKATLGQVCAYRGVGRRGRGRPCPGGGMTSRLLTPHPSPLKGPGQDPGPTRRAGFHLHRPPRQVRRAAAGRGRCAVRCGSNSGSVAWALRQQLTRPPSLARGRGVGWGRGDRARETSERHARQLAEGEVLRLRTALEELRNSFTAQHQRWEALEEVREEGRKRMEASFQCAAATPPPLPPLHTVSECVTRVRCLQPHNRGAAAGAKWGRKRRVARKQRRSRRRGGAGLSPCSRRHSAAARRGGGAPRGEAPLFLLSPF